MKTITIDVIKGTADVHAVEGDVGVKVIITNTPQEWKNCTVFALLTQGSKSQHIKVIDNTFEIPPAFTDANKAFKFGVYAVGADASRDVRPSIWIRVADSDFTTDDIEITQQTIEDILTLQAQYTQYENAEKNRAEAEELRQANESARIEAENNRKTELAVIKTRLSDVETDIDTLESCKVEKIKNSDTVNLIYAESPDGKGTKSVRNTQVASPKSIPIRGSNGELIVRKNPSIPDEAVSKEFVETAIANKVDKVEGYQLSQNNFSDNECMKLIGIEDNAQKNVQSDWNTSDTKSDAYIKNKPVIDQTYQNKSSNAQSGKAVAQAIAQLVGSAPETLDTIEEVAKAIAENEDVVAALESAIGNKSDKTELDTKADKQTDNGGFAGGNKAGAGYGSAVGAYATAGDGGAVGCSASAGDGGAVGDEAKAAAGGAVGENAYTNYGGAVGCSASAGDGGAVGWYATTSDGFAGGYKAKAIDTDGNAIDAIQLGTGTNNTPKSLQIYNYTLMNADGRIPAERMAVRPITEIPATLSPNTSYNFGAVESLHIAFPAIANDGDVIYLTFMVGNSNTDITINFTYASDIDIEITPNTGYEIFAKYNGEIWIVGWSEYKKVTS